jgi:hypothetical protein
MTALAIAAALGAVFALMGGIAAMMYDGAVGAQRSEAWMGWRVLAQAVALLFIVLGLAGTAAT